MLFVTDFLLPFAGGVLASLAAAVIYDLVRTMRQRPWAARPFWASRRPLRPGIRSARDLDRLIVVLMDVRSWLGASNSGLVTVASEYVWSLIKQLEVVKLGYVAMNAQIAGEQKYAIKQLGQIATPEAKTLLKFIEANELLDDDVRRCAKDEFGKLQ